MAKAKTKRVRERIEPGDEVGVPEQSWARPEPNYGARLSQVKTCAFCKHDYVNPCSDKSKDKCRNWLWLQSQGKKAHAKAR